MEFTAISDWFSDHTGISPAILGDHTLRWAVNRRMEASGEAYNHNYFRKLLQSEAEQEALVELLVVPETWFFRDRQPFLELATWARERLAAQAEATPLRLLSAPCSSGEEPYSMAITLLDHQVPSRLFHIDAIDICAAALDRARRAIYSRYSFRGVTVTEQERHFKDCPEGWVLNPNVRRCVHFRQGSLSRCLEQMTSPYDVIFCRNLLIYLQAAAADSLLASIGQLLKPGGLLVVGAAEMARVPRPLFEPLGRPFSCGFWYRGIAESATKGITVSTTVPAQPPQQPLPPSPALTEADRRSQDLEHYQRLLERDPTRVFTYLRMADLLIEGGEPWEAIACLRKGLYLQPRSREILERLTTLCCSTGQLEQGRRYQERLSRLDS